ncbi:filamentous hemagglutinin N-terminal domain-containing protein, partial [Microvirga sp. W0021]
MGQGSFSFSGTASRIGFWFMPRRVLSLFLAGTMALTGPFGVLSSVAQAQIISDPRANIQFQPRVGTAPNGVPLVDITKPSFGGVSHNKFEHYNVDTRGVILNNSGLGGTSILGGRIEGNPNLVNSRPASVILNEVTSTNTSLLNGPTEVFGTKADVIVANPNGVTCRSCTFINTGRVTLSSGVPVPDYQNGTVGFKVTRGTVTVEGGGIAAINPDGTVGKLSNVDLVGRQLRVDAPIDATGHVRLRAGAINWDQNSDTVSRITGADIPVVTGDAIVSSAGGMIRAGTISVLSHDTDLGVQLQGDLTSLGFSFEENGQVHQIVGLVTVRSGGDLSIGSAGSTGDIRLEADGILTIGGDQQALGRITGVGRDVTVAKDIRAQANDAIIFEAVRNVLSEGYLQSNASAISLVGGGTVTASGGIYARDMVSLEGQSVSTSGLEVSGDTITVSGLDQTTLEQTILVAKRDIYVLGYDMRLGQDTKFQAGEGNSGRFLIDVRGTLTNATTLNYPNLTLNLGKSLINEATGQIVANDLRLILTDQIVNAGILYGYASTQIAASQLDNLSEAQIYGPDVAIDVSGAMTNDGTIYGDRGTEVTANSLNAGANSVIYGAQVIVNVAQSLSNAGVINGKDSTAITAGSITNIGSVAQNADGTSQQRGVIYGG